LALGAFLALLNPALLAGKGEQMNNAARIFAGYLISRNLSLTARLAGARALRAGKVLGDFLTLTALIQFVDAAVDCSEQRWAVVTVMVLLGLAFLTGAGSALGRSVWKIAPWRDSRAACHRIRKLPQNALFWSVARKRELEVTL